MKMTSFSFEGMMAPVFAPMDKTGLLNLKVIPTYAQYLSSRGVKGVYVAGTVGEGLSMSVDERKILTESWVKASGPSNLKVMAMIGTAGLKDSMDLAAHAESLGVAAIATIPPLYDKPETVDELVDYCAEVAQAAPKTPFFYYHIPFKTGVCLPMDEFFRRASTRIPTLAGMKFTSESIETESLACHQMDSGKFRIFVAFDHLLYKALNLGYDCAISVCFNFLPEMAAEMFESVKKGKTSTNKSEREVLLQNAETKQKEITQILEQIFASKGGSFSVPPLKAAMSILTPIDVGPARKPQKPLSPDEHQKLSRQLLSSGN